MGPQRTIMDLVHQGVIQNYWPCNALHFMNCDNLHLKRSILQHMDLNGPLGFYSLLINQFNCGLVSIGFVLPVVTFCLNTLDQISIFWSAVCFLQMILHCRYTATAFSPVRRTICCTVVTLPSLTLNLVRLAVTSRMPQMTPHCRYPTIVPVGTDVPRHRKFTTIFQQDLIRANLFKRNTCFTFRDQVLFLRDASLQDVHLSHQERKNMFYS